MAGTTISSTTSIGLTLAKASQNPVTITAAGTINTTGAGIAAIFGNYGVFATITNDGLLAATAGYGIELTSGGRITNGSTADTAARISGTYGIRTDINGSGTIKNFGTITGTSGAGINTRGKGVVTNGAPNSTLALVSGYFSGVQLQGAGSTLANFGTITATGTQTTSSAGSIGAYLGNGGQVTNGANAARTALVTGGVVGVEIDHAAGTVTNFGTIAGTTGTGRGISLGFGGTITNGSAADTTARIAGNGRGGIFSGGDASIANSGTITDPTFGTGVRVLGTATISNGTAGLISGYAFAINATAPGATLDNQGTIQARATSNAIGATAEAVYLANGGTITNGSATNTAATITSPGFGVDISHGAGSVVNFGTIAGTGLAGRGISFGAGGSVVNGSTAATAATISATFRNGIYIGGGDGTVTNFGTISAASRNGVSLGTGGTITNGSTADTTALITGQQRAIYSRGDTASVVNNFGTLASISRNAVNLYQGGSLTNGSATSTAARITGATGVFMGATGTVTNFGTIDGTTGSGVANRGAGSIINGSTAVTTALITGRLGISGGLGATTIANFATITGTASSAISLAAGGRITNGATSDTIAVISAGTASNAVFLSAGATTLSNFGTIIAGTGIRAQTGASATITNSGTIASTAGATGNAILLADGNDRVVLLPGATFTGKVNAGTGTDTLELAKGTGTGSIAGIGTTFLGFEALAVNTNAKWAFGGNNAIASLTNTGQVTVLAGATLNVAAVDPASTGLFQINNTATLDLAADTGAANTVKFIGTARLAIDTAANFGTGIGTAGYTGPLLQGFGTTATIDMKDLPLAGLTQNFNASTGLLQLGGTGTGSLRFDLATLGTGSFHLSDDGSGHALLSHF